MTETQVVVDASIVIKSVLPDPLRESCRALLASLAASERLAPTLWAYEVTSAVSKAVRRGLVTQNEGQRVLSHIPHLNIHLIPPEEAQRRAAFEWGLRVNLPTVYDSFYLALADSLDCDLWTADQRLFGALSLPWVRWVQEYMEAA